MSSSINIPSKRAASKAVASSPAGSAYSMSSSSPTSTPSSSPKSNPFHGRRPSLLSSALSQEESTVINIGDPNGPPRLISYLSSSQGFAWNPELFVPSYIDCEYITLENRRDPVHEIHLTDEESREMLPQ